MSRKTSVLLVLILLGCLYFVIFCFPNATGARDLNMTYLFSSDEPAQYPHMVRMLTPANTLAQSLYRFFAYQQYVYGFPYWSYAAVFALLPIKLLVGLGNVSLDMLVLRQVVSVLPMIVAVMLLVFLQTGFRSHKESILLFLLLLAVPEVVLNDMWLHPESLVLLFIVLTFFFLSRDDLRFGRDFYLAAVFCGIATATKLLGLFFFLAIPLYIFLGWRQGRISVRKSVGMAVAFVAVMLLAFIASSPYLYWESQREFALKIQTRMNASLSSGFIVAYQSAAWSWFGIIFQEYAVPGFLLLAVGALIIGMLRGERRLLNILIAAWAVPFFVYISFGLEARPKHFLLPIILPIISAVPAYFHWIKLPAFQRPLGAYLRQNARPALLLSLGALAVGWQAIYSLGVDVSSYHETLTREQTSPSLAYYARIDQQYLSRIVVDRPLVVFRDVAMYVPDTPAYDVHFQWGVSNYGDIQKLDPDLLVLSKQHLLDYTQPGQTALDPSFAETYRFYSDALAGHVAGYTLLDRDDYGLTYIRTDLYGRFFAASQ